MIAPPKLSPVHPDRGIDCEMAAEAAFRALTESIEASGWTADEAASALLSLALNHIRYREETAADELRISAARKARSH